MAVNKVAVNKVAVNKVAVNKVAVNKVAVNKVAVAVEPPQLEIEFCMKSSGKTPGELELAITTKTGLVPECI